MRGLKLFKINDGGFLFFFGSHGSQMIPRTFRDLLERKGDHRALERADKMGQAFLLLFPRT